MKALGMLEKVSVGLGAEIRPKMVEEKGQGTENFEGKDPQIQQNPSTTTPIPKLL